ncbi:cathepsin B, partial [Trifolium medium]|nr:cathepsin B [Trifolium medium]
LMFPLLLISLLLLISHAISAQLAVQGQRSPIPVGVRWIKEIADFREDGIYNEPIEDDTFVSRAGYRVGAHSLLVVGFGSEIVQGHPVEFWIVQNSHGVRWRYHGYAKFNVTIRCGGGDIPLING